MILEALDALKHKKGANKSVILKYIESKYGGVSDAHSKLLTFHLERIMKQGGDLLFLKNNYIKPGPDARPKRDCGRRPKPKGLVASGTIFAPPSPMAVQERTPMRLPLPRRPRRRLPLHPRPGGHVPSRRREEQRETNEGDAATVRHPGVHAAAIVDLLNLPEIPALSLLPYVVEDRSILPSECSKSPRKGRTGGTIVGAAVVAPLVVEFS
nr:HMG-Y-related protein A-like [Ipomoea trifida]